MPDDDLILDPDERVFSVGGKAGRNALLWLVGGIAALVAAIVGFLVAVFSRVDQLSLHMMSTLPAILGFGALASAWMTARTARGVAVGPDGLRVIGRRDERRFAWSEIGWANVQPGPVNQRRQLKIYDTQGRLLARFSDAIEDFEAMADMVKANIAAKQDNTAGRIQASKARRTAIYMTLGGTVFLALAGFLAWETHREARAQRLLAETGIAGIAEIEDRFLAPNGVTPRLVYRITTADGRTASRNAEVERGVWDQLEGAKRVAVVYVPDEPAISRLAFGEAERRDFLKTPVGGYGLAGLVAAMSLFFIGAAILMFRGWDIDFDSKTRRISIKRLGSGA
jgi:hypothetical protein